MGVVAVVDVMREGIFGNLRELGETIFIFGTIYATLASPLVRQKFNF